MSAPTATVLDGGPALDVLVLTGGAAMPGPRASTSGRGLIGPLPGRAL